MEYLVSEGFIPETLAENRAKGGSVSGAQGFLKSLKRSLWWTLLHKRKPPIDSRAINYLGLICENDFEELEAILGRGLPELRKVW